ncbi:MAG: glycosyltransferase family 4 protein [Acidobacteriota bacterium]|nr:glycosyltransferase family 4 protein [Acidobacteriota bacterium]
MNICYFADGRSIHTKRWMKYFIGRGQEMFLLSYVPLAPQEIAELEEMGVRYRGHTGGFHLKKFWLTLRDLRKLRRVLKQDKIDILHCHFLGAHTWLAALSRFHPYIITIMGGGDVRGRNWQPNANKAEKILTPYALRKADYVTSWSHLMADVARPYCSAPIEVIHGGVHLDKFFPGDKPQYLLDRWQIPSDAKVIFSPRLMRPLSNIDKIAEAFVEVSRNAPDAYLIIAAPSWESFGDYENKVRDIIDRASLTAKARFVGMIPHHEIADYFRLADVTVAIPDIDGTPMTAMESMACSVPTVIGNQEDYDAEYFENEKTTLMVDVKNSSEIAKAILRLWSDKELSKRIIEEARRRTSESGGYETQMAKMERIYSELENKR